MRKVKYSKYLPRCAVLLNIDEKHEICINLVKYQTGLGYEWIKSGKPYLMHRDNGLEDTLIRGMNEILLYLKNHISNEKYLEVEKFYMEIKG